MKEDFVVGGEFFWNYSTSINIHLQLDKERPRGEKMSGFHQETLENFILDEKFYLQMTTIRTFFLQIRALFSNFGKKVGETSPF